MTSHSALKILMVNNFMTDMGGTEPIVLGTCKALEKLGHTVEVFCTDKAPMFEDYTYAHLFPKSIDHDEAKTLGEKLTSVSKVFQNNEAVAKFRTLLHHYRPDVVHVHNIFWHLTPAILQVCQEQNIPSVMTLHDSRVVCPAGTLLFKGKDFCADLKCATQGAHHAVINRCYEHSLAKSTIAAAEFQFRHMQGHLNKVDQFICPTRALADLLVQTQVPDSKLNVVSNFLDDSWMQEPTPHEAGKYYIYAGRLSREKGVHYILEAMVRFDIQTPLRIVGKGPEQASLEAYVQENKLQQRVQFLGHVSQQELKTLYAHSIASIIPSNWFEAFGMTIIETQATGRPVIGSNIGGIPTNVKDNETGLLIEAGNVEQLGAAMLRLVSEPETAFQLGKQAQRHVRETCSISAYSSSLLAVYTQARGNALNLL